MAHKLASRRPAGAAVHGGAHVLDENLQHKLEIDMRFLDVGSTCSANFSLQQGVLALPGPCDVALRGDALTLLQSLPDGCTPLVFFGSAPLSAVPPLPTTTNIENSKHG
jgi:hypothetical protein